MTPLDTHIIKTHFVLFINYKKEEKIVKVYELVNDIFIAEDFLGSYKYTSISKNSFEEFQMNFKNYLNKPNGQ